MDIIKTDTDISVVGQKPQAARYKLSKKHKSKKIRRLGERRKAEPQIVFRINKQRLYIAAFLLIAMTAFLGQQHLTVENSKNLLNHFMKTYRKQYNEIVYGRQDFCAPDMDTSKLFKQIRHHQIVLQETALRLLNAALRNDSQLNAIAVVGPRGVGKTMWARALAQHFLWPNNVHSYSWNTAVKEEQKFDVLRMFANRLSDCGRNLLIIDSLRPMDREVVNIFNEMIAKTIAESAKNNKRVVVVVVYIFSLGVIDDSSLAAIRFEELHEIPGINTVNFRAFGRQDVMDCIRRELFVEGYTLDPNILDEVIETIDVNRSGCKNVHSKLMAYGATKP